MPWASKTWNPFKCFISWWFIIPCMADWPDPPWHTYQHDKLRSSSKLSVLSFFRYTVKYLSCCFLVQWIWAFEHVPIKIGSWSSWYRRTHVIVIKIVTSWTVSSGYQWIIAQKWWHRELHTKKFKKDREIHMTSFRNQCKVCIDHLFVIFRFFPLWKRGERFNECKWGVFAKGWPVGFIHNVSITFWQR